MKSISGKIAAVRVMAVIGFCAMSAACADPSPAQASRPSSNIVRQVDHILIASSDAKELFSLLADTFQFPAAWPMSHYGGFASGGVALGNVNLEIIKAAGAGKSRFTGFALEPEPLRTSLPELKARRISHGKPAPFRSKQADGSATTLWTTVGLPSVSGDGVEIFFCEYGHDVPAKRGRLLGQLRSSGGGPLSVHSVKEIVIGARDVERMQGQWQDLLNPLQASSPAVWPVGAGPAIRVIQAEEEEIRGLVINVASLEKARRFLKERGLLGAEQPSVLTVAGSQLQGLNITLVELPGGGL